MTGERHQMPKDDIPHDPKPVVFVMIGMVAFAIVLGVFEDRYPSRAAGGIATAIEESFEPALP